MFQDFGSDGIFAISKVINKVSSTILNMKRVIVGANISNFLQTARFPIANLVLGPLPNPPPPILGPLVINRVVRNVL